MKISSAVIIDEKQTKNSKEYHTSSCSSRELTVHSYHQTSFKKTDLFKVCLSRCKRMPSVKTSVLLVTVVIRPIPKVLCKKEWLACWQWSRRDGLNSNSNSNSSCTDEGGKDSMSGLCHNYQDQDRGVRTRSKATCFRLHLRTWEYSRAEDHG